MLCPLKMAGALASGDMCIIGCTSRYAWCDGHNCALWNASSKHCGLRGPGYTAQLFTATNEFTTPLTQGEFPPVVIGSAMAGGGVGGTSSVPPQEEPPDHVIGACKDDAMSPKLSADCDQCKYRARCDDVTYTYRGGNV